MCGVYLRILFFVRCLCCFVSDISTNHPARREHVHIPNAVFTREFLYACKIETGKFFAKSLLRFLLFQLIPGIVRRWRLLLRLKLS